MQTNNGIHCKVSSNDQFRRFLFVGTEFSSLFSQVQQLLALDKEFLLIYKDTEGDLITLTSNEELACALSYSEGNLLRLVAAPKDQAPVTTDSDDPVCSRGFPCAKRGQHGGRGHFRGGNGWEHGGRGHFRGGLGWEHMHGGRGHFRGSHGREHVHGGHGHPHGGSRSERLTSKRDFFKSQLDELEKVPEKTPEQQQEVLRLQEKLKKIESRLEGGCWEKGMKGKHCGKWAKMEKRRQKMEKRMRKKEQKDKCSTRNLSEETQTQIAILKSQIDVLKPAMKEVKSQIKTKKAALKEATGGDPQQFKELSVLKEKRKAQKNEVNQVS